MKLLTYTSLYPNNIQQRHGIFVEQRLRHLLGLDELQSKVVAPVPWFPSKLGIFGDYAKFNRIKKIENRYDIEIIHPKYLTIPKVGMTVAPILMSVFTYPVLQRIIKQGYDFDVIDAHYFYPDGVAAAILSKLLKKPFVITARGSDINIIPEYFLPKKMILWAANEASGIITVSNALKNKLERIGCHNDIRVMRNGVDLDTFEPRERCEYRKKYSIKKKTLLSVGNLIELKGHHLIIEAMKTLTEYDLIIVGDGADLEKLKMQAYELGVSASVRFLGTLSHSQLVEVYNAVDILVLASSSEGMANVLLESLACGTSVVATNVGGVAEIIKSKVAGIIIEKRTSEDIVVGIRSIMSNLPARKATREYAERFSWNETVTSLNDYFQEVLQ